ATRILEQFVAQVFAVILLRNLQPDRPRPWRMWLYPVPCVVALVGWLLVYISTGGLFIAIGAGTLLVGVIVFLTWAVRQGGWPFGDPASPPLRTEPPVRCTARPALPRARTRRGPPPTRGPASARG